MFGNGALEAIGPGFGCALRDYNMVGHEKQDLGWTGEQMEGSSMSKCIIGTLIVEAG